MAEKRTQIKAKDHGLVQKCTTHEDKLIEFICRDHDEVCCSTCLNTVHVTCPNTSYIPDISGDEDVATSYNTLVQELQDIQGKTKTILNTIATKLQQSKENNKRSLDKLRSFRKEVNKIMDTMEIEAERKVKIVDSENKTRCKNATAQCDSVLSEVTSLLSALDAKANQRDQLYVNMKIAEHRYFGLQEEVDEGRRCAISTCSLGKDRLLTELRSVLLNAVSVTASHVGSFTRAHFLKDINAKSKDESRSCQFSGIAVLDDDCIAVTDLKNKSLKLISIEEDTILSRVSFASEPCDVVAIGNNKMGVALGDESKIDILTASDSGDLSQSWSIDVSGECSNLAYSQGQLIIGFENPGMIKVMDMRGTLLSTFRTDSNGDDLFQTPNAIALSRNHNAILVSDLHTNTVTRMTRDGHVVSVYRSEMLKCSTGVATGSDDSVFVCSADTNTVHQIAPNGMLQRIILDKERGLVDRPNAVACSLNDNRLYISNFSTKKKERNFIRVYQLEQ